MSMRTGDIVMDGLSGSKAFEMRDQLLPVGYPVGSHLLADAWREDLLGAAAAHVKHAFERSAVNPRDGKSAKFGGDSVEVAAPGGFIGHKAVSIGYHSCKRFCASAHNTP